MARWWVGHQIPEMSSQVSMGGLSVPALLSTVEKRNTESVFCSKSLFGFFFFNQNSWRQIKVMNVTRECAEPQKRARGLAWEGEDEGLAL